MNSLLPSPTTCLIVAATIVVWAVMRYWYFKYPDRVAVFGYPIVGAAIFILTPETLRDFLLDYGKKYGPIFDVFVFTKRITILTDLDDITEILFKRPKQFARPTEHNSRAPGEILGFNEGVFAANGEEWSRQRRVTAPPFSKKGVSKYLLDIWKESEVAAISLIADNVHVTDMIDVASSFTVSVIGKIAFGFSEKDDGSFFYSDQFKKDLKTMLTFYTRKLLFGLPDIIWRWSPSFKYEREAIIARDRVNKIGMEILAKERLKEDNGSFIQTLIRAEGESRFSDKAVIANILTIFVAGTDTTAVALCWTLYHLSLNTHVLNELKREVDSVFESLTSQQQQQQQLSDMDAVLSKLTLCTACVQEAMRLNAPVNRIAVETANKEQPITLKSGIVIRPTDNLWCSTNGLKMNEEIFPQPTVFDPHRWLTTDAKQLLLMETYSPTFGFGPRLCPGMHLALAEATFAVAHIVRRFDFRVAGDDNKKKEIKAVSLVTDSPSSMPLVFRPRTAM